MHKVLSSLITMRNEDPSKANMIEPYWCIWRKRQCTVSQVDCNDVKTTWIAFWIASTLTLFSRSGPQQLLAVCRPQKNAPEKQIWLQWSDIGNWGIFWGQRKSLYKKGIKLFQKHWNQCITIERDYIDE